MCHMGTHRLDVAEIGRRLAGRRENLHLDQEAVAERAGMSRAYVSRLERGIVPAPKVTELAAVAEALGLTIVDLVTPARASVDRTCYSHEWDELQAQVEGLDPEIAVQILRAWRESAAVLHNASALARRN